MPRAPSSRAQHKMFVAAFRSNELDSEGPGGASTQISQARSARTRLSQLREYLRWLAPHRAGAGIVIVLALGVAGMEMVQPLFLRHIVDRVLLNPALDGASRFRALNLAGVTFLALVILGKVLDVLKGYRQRMLNTQVMVSLRRALFRRFLHLPLPTLSQMKTGGVLSRLTGDVDTTTGLLQMAVVSPSLSIVRLLVAIGILLSINWRLALTALAIMPGALLISFTSAKRIRPIYRSIRKDAERVDARVGETFSGIRVVRAFAREREELLAYLRGRHTILRKELFAGRRELLLWSTWGLLLGVVNVAIVWYGGALNLRGKASIGDIMAFQWYAFLLLTPVWNIVNTFSELQRSLASMERVFDVLSQPEDKPDRAGAVDAPRVVHDVRFDDVGFSYRDGHPVLHGISIAVRAGSVVALVGRSGAGKTTITDLVARFHDPDVGRVLVNGSDVRNMKLRSYRQLLGIVQQDVFLFDGSVEENIRYARPDATSSAVIEAARRANAHEFIAALPEGYDTLVGERGVRLSGGQQQRLAIARAILASPQILILDEATSNLDTESEQLIQAALETLLKGRTTFVIAHRLSTIRTADLILLVDGGRVIEQGTHESLMASAGPYSEMYLRQVRASEALGNVLG
jgi:ATP-binding cassette subfamily B protein